MKTSPAAEASSPVNLRKVGAHRGIRALAWHGDILYASRGYQIVRANPRLDLPSNVGNTPSPAWESVARFRPALWRNLASRSTLTYRLAREGFHALSILDGNGMIAAVPGAIVTRVPTSTEFIVTHTIGRGTRPLHITTVPGGVTYWGEYFGNRERAEVHIYASADRGESWQIAYTFPAGSIRHIHNIVYDRWGDCLWILTGDEGAECKILRASCDLRVVDEVLSGNQQARAAAAIPMPDALYFSTDTPFESNHILRLDRSGNVRPIAGLASSSIYGCRVGEAMFFSTMVEPGAVNHSREVHITGSKNGSDWRVLARWQKDKLSMRYFQYGNAMLPDGDTTTNYLAATTIAVQQDDLVTTLWEVA
jgi:hypothetical protein